MLVGFSGGELVGHLILTDTQFAPQNPVAGLNPQQHLTETDELPGQQIVLVDMPPLVRQAVLEPQFVGVAAS
jgi:hypothetical protein